MYYSSNHFTHVPCVCCLGEIKALCKKYYERLCEIEGTKYDIEKEVEFKDYRVGAAWPGLMLPPARRPVSLSPSFFWERKSILVEMP